MVSALDYRLGYATGYDVGYAHGLDDEGAAWSSIVTGCTDTWRSPRQDELRVIRDEVRHDPCPSKCRACSRCFHSLSYWARGGRPYLGVEGEQRRVGQGDQDVALGDAKGELHRAAGGAS